MKLASVRLIVSDIKAMAAFYERLTQLKADWLAPVFAEFVTPGGALALGSAETVSVFKPGLGEPGANRTATVEFIVDDVDAEFARLKDEFAFEIEPRTMPWGNRCAQLRDPEGTLVSLFTPVTDFAKQRFGGR